MVYIIGAGPGDPELITVKGARLLAEAEVVIYTGSLVNPAVLDYCNKEAVIHNSAGMTLDQVLAVIRKAIDEGKRVARVHTGDPALYGAIQEQIDALENMGIPFEVTPGVSSFLAAAAAIPHELTLPGITQTVILTRVEGRTPMPANEKLADLAVHGSTMCIFLSVHMIEQVVQELLEGGYAEETPVYVVERASWPGQRIVKGTIGNIAARVKEEGITKTALIIVSKAFNFSYAPSKLYDRSFKHGYREPS